MTSRLKSVFSSVFLLVLFSALIGSEWWLSPAVSGRISSSILGEIKSVFDQGDTQVWVFASLLVYLASFLFIFLRKHGPDKGRLIALAIFFLPVTLSYFFLTTSFDTSSRNVLTLTGTCVVGLGMAFFAGPNLADKTRWLGRVSLVLIFLLAIGSLVKGDQLNGYEYRAVERHGGLWGNPNTYGLLMSCGLVLATGLLVSKLSTARSASWKGILCAVFLGAAATLLLRGTILSMSRGAWLGAAMAFGWLAYGYAKQPLGDAATLRGKPPWWTWLLANRRSVFVLVIAFGLLSFWTLRHVEHPYIRRAFTMGNPSDLSWRNRVISYEQALQMIGDRPWLGYGWSQWQTIHREFYQPLTQDEGGAITLNDYFIMSIASGLPALLAFLAYVWLAISSRQDKGKAFLEPADFLHYAAHACAIVLLVGFWFDGGLFKLALVTPFWMLIELGYRQSSETRKVDRLAVTAL